MTSTAGQVLGVRVSLTGWQSGREDDVSNALAAVASGMALPAVGDLPVVALETPSKDEAEQAYDLLEAAGGVLEVSRVWVDPTAGGSARPTCPRCGSTRTQPWTHAGPAARVNHRCDACGSTFRA